VDSERADFTDAGLRLVALHLDLDLDLDGATPTRPPSGATGWVILANA
jgi:hypothetical protein